MQECWDLWYNIIIKRVGIPLPLLPLEFIMAKSPFRAGDIVTLKTTAFEREWNGTDYVPSDKYHANYKATQQDRDDWREAQYKAVKEAREAGEDTFSIAFDDGGESRLPPQGGRTPLFRGTGYRVLRARCRVSFSYYNPTGGWTKLLDLNTGREVYVKQDKLEKVVA